MCEKFRLCGAPIFWYDDFPRRENKAASLLKKAASLLEKAAPLSENALEALAHAFGPILGKVSWRDSFTEWVQALPVTPVTVPPETEREELKRKHREIEQERKEMEDQLKKLQNELKYAH
eukprot:2638571-Ditylum_brightwellii.AAC.1